MWKWKENMNNSKFENTSKKTSIQNLHIKNILAFHILNFLTLKNIIFICLLIGIQLYRTTFAKKAFSQWSETEPIIPWFTFNQLNCFIQFLSVSTVMVHCQTKTKMFNFFSISMLLRKQRETDQGNSMICRFIKTIVTHVRHKRLNVFVSQ